MIEGLFGKRDKLLRTAQSSIDCGNLKEARNLLLELASLKPDTPTPLLYLAIVENYDNNHEQSLQYINEALEIKGISDPQVYSFFKAIIYFDQNKFKDALSILKSSPVKTNYYEFLTDLCEITEKVINNDNKDAQHSLQKLLLFSKGSLDIQARAIEILESKIDCDYANRASQASFPDAFQPIIFQEKRISSSKGFVKKNLDAVDLLLAKSSLKKALQLIDRIQTEGVSFTEIEMKQKEIGHFINENTESSINEIGYSSALFLLTHAGHYDSVISLGTKYLEESTSNDESIKKNYQVYELLGISLFSIQDYQRAVQYFEQIINCTEHDKTITYYYLAASYTHLNRRFDSIRFYKSFILSSLESYETAIKLNMKTLFPELLLT